MIALSKFALLALGTSLIKARNQSELHEDILTESKKKPMTQTSLCAAAISFRWISLNSLLALAPWHRRW